MQRALKLAAETIGLASPNPQVGCVLVRATPNGDATKIIGEGAHLYDDRDHAEIVALKQASARGISTKGATAYVTLEPCSSPRPHRPMRRRPHRCRHHSLRRRHSGPEPPGQRPGYSETSRRKHRSDHRRPRAACTRPQRRLRPLHPDTNSLRHPEGRALRRWQTRSTSRLALSQPASLAHRPRRAPRSATPPPRQRRRPHRHRHRPRRRPPAHRPQRHLRRTVCPAAARSSA